MKRKTYIPRLLVWVAICFTLLSCNDFLDMTPRDKRVVESIEDYRDIMASYLYLITTTQNTQVKVFGIDVNAYPRFGVSDVLSIYTGESSLRRIPGYFDEYTNRYNEKGVRYLTWQQSPSLVWDKYYMFVGPINLLINEIAEAKGDDEAMRDYVRGEAHVWRAFAHFKLLQYYAPYKNNELGIPLFLDPTDNIGTAMPPRSTQKEGYEQVLSDCREALNLLEKTPTHTWNVAYRPDFVHAMMASVYAWKALSGAGEESDWENAARSADEAMKGKNIAESVDVLKRMFDCKGNNASNPYFHSEFHVRIAGKPKVYSDILDISQAYYVGISTGEAAKEFVDMYSDNDLRKTFYFSIDERNNVRNDKYNQLKDIEFTRSGGVLMPFRLAETLLVRAEAACRVGDVATATALLKKFKNSRYSLPQIVDTSNAEDLLKEVLAERKREFYLENDLLWLDMKRLGVKMEREVNGEIETLQPDDFRYAFPIPVKELEKNKNKKMVQNPGWEGIAQ